LITIALAQHDFLVGAIRSNLAKALVLVASARDAGADLLIFPELALTGYPPEDLLLRPGFLENCDEAVQEMARQVHGIDVVFGHPRMEHGRRFNTASWMREGHVIGRYDKQVLPNYAVFDERRYFTPGTESLVVDLKGVRI
jgi:NAD+ synthase (glutamine-hydrolysing)